jgi:hypothetical protein
MADDEQLDSSGRQFSKDFFGTPQEDITKESRDFLEQKRLQDALRDAKPAILKDRRGVFESAPLPPSRTQNQPLRSDFGNGSVNRQPPKSDFPELTTASVTQVKGVSIPKITFICSDVSVAEGDPPVVSNKVHVADGEINGELPAGMGAGNFVLDLTDPTDQFIYAYVTFDPETLAITSRTVAATDVGSMPESRVDEGGGFLVYILAEAFMDDNVPPKFQVVNRRVGDINFELVYGSLNGQPALLPVTSEPGFLDLTSLL